MQRQNIFTGIKVLASSNIETNLNEQKNSRNQKENNELISIKQNAVVVRSRQSFKVFKFDSCLDKNSGQQQIYDNFALNMVEDFINGYDCTLILCGENNKKNNLTDIVLGKQTQQMKGIIPRMIEQLNNSIRYFSQRKFLIKVSFLQVNSQQMIDLLAVKKCKLQIKQQKHNKTQFHVNNLQIKPIQKIDEIESFYLVGNRKREYAYSKDYRKRENSSGFFTVYLESLEQSGTIYRQSKFTICELAQNVFQEVDGIGMGKSMEVTLQNKFLQSTHLKKFNSPNVQSLNLSSYAFQNVINTLVYGDQHTTVPYKDSKVTKLLRSALGGTHKTSILSTIDPSNQSSLPKTFKILKTLQIAAQIQNSPTNLKQISEQSQQNKTNVHIVGLLEQINQLSNQLETTKITLQQLINNQNYVSEQMKKIQQKNGDSLIKDNQFCSQQNLQDRVLQQKTKKQWQLKQSIKDIQKILKQKISFIHNLSNQENHHQDDDGHQSFAKEEFTIAKRKQILLRIRNVKQKRLNSMPNIEMQQMQREKKRQIFALEIEFQKQRNLYLSTIRQLEEKLSLYKKIAENSLKPEEIEMIRTSSKFDETKREFDIPLFMIKDKKMMPGNVVSRLVSQRKFFVSPRSSSFNSLHSNNASRKSSKALQMKNTLNNILSRKPQNLQKYRSQYQIDNNISRDSKKTTKNKRNSRSKQLITMVARHKSPSDPIKPNKNHHNLMNKLQNTNDHMKKVVSDYEIGQIDINRVISYNQQRKTLKSKGKDLSARSPNNLMRRQKLNTQPPIRAESKQGKNNILSPQKDYFPKSPRQQPKKWL